MKRNIEETIGIILRMVEENGIEVEFEDRETLELTAQELEHADEFEILDYLYSLEENLMDK